MTAPEDEAQQYFREILSLGPTGHEFPDELVRQAATRLDIIQRTPGESPLLSKASAQGTRGDYPFPRMMTIKPAAESGPSEPRRIATVSGGLPNIRSSPKRPGGHGRQTSIASFQSYSASCVLSTPIKSSASLASLFVDDEAVEAHPHSASDRSAGSAADLLRRLRDKSDAEVAEKVRRDARRKVAAAHEARWPSLAQWRMGAPSPPASAEPWPSNSLSKVSGDIVGSQSSGGTVRPPVRHPSTIVPATDLSSTTEPSRHSSTRRTLHVAQRSEDLPTHLVPSVLRTIASSPQFPVVPKSSGAPPSGSGSSTPRRRLPFEPDEYNKIAAIDPTLAAAELASALTMHVVCGVCAAQGINFPHCRKCGLTFCSRECRVGEKKAGDGKRWVEDIKSPLLELRADGLVQTCMRCMGVEKTAFGADTCIEEDKQAVQQ